MSSSQNKKERREARHQRNKEKDKKLKQENWDNGKLVLENHSGEDFSPKFTIELRDRLYQYIVEQRAKAKDPYEFLRSFRQYKSKIIQLILQYNPNVEKDERYYFLKHLLELYWDEVIAKENLKALW